MMVLEEVIHKIIFSLNKSNTDEFIHHKLTYKIIAYAHMLGVLTCCDALRHENCANIVGSCQYSQLDSHTHGYNYLHYKPYFFRCF